MASVAFSRRTFLLALATGWTCRQAGSGSPAPPDDRIGEIEWQILFVTNQQRIWQKVPPLEGSPALAGVARAHSRDMLTRGFFAHVNPEGLSPKARVVKARLPFKVVAENIYSTRNGTMDAAELASLMVSGWMKHEGHRRNILAPSLKYLGVGVAMSDSDVLATQLFGG